MPDPAPARRPLPREPVFDLDFPDPYVLHDGPGRWLAYGTDNNGCHVQCLTSTNLVDWTGPTDALPQVASWAVANRIWSPVADRVGDGYVLWYSIHKRDSPRQAISVATSDRAEGPYIDRTDQPLIFVSDDIGSIDPSPFVDTDGSRYLVWKADAKLGRGTSTLWIQRLSDDGLRLVDEKHAVLVTDAPWEGTVVEAPCLILIDGIYYLFYSGNNWATERYAVGYATASSPLGPYKKRTRSRPWVATDDVVWGPGGQEWTTDDDGSLVMVYHGWDPGRVGNRQGRRRLHVARAEFVNGKPVLELPSGSAKRRWWPFG
ncbi:MAG TPA: glycoside hydrolase family 43 protein [Acidimicrobiales bacterium]|nr:glycoside hydrolase family 43 protein [Acidimicrobiales bacterium]